MWSSQCNNTAHKHAGTCVRSDNVKETLVQIWRGQRGETLIYRKCKLNIPLQIISSRTDNNTGARQKMWTNSATFLSTKIIKNKKRCWGECPYPLIASKPPHRQDTVNTVCKHKSALCRFVCSTVTVYWCAFVTETRVTYNSFTSQHCRNISGLNLLLLDWTVCHIGTATGNDPAAVHNKKKHYSENKHLMTACKVTLILHSYFLCIYEPSQEGATMFSGSLLWKEWHTGSETKHRAFTSLGKQSDFNNTLIACKHPALN